MSQVVEIRQAPDPLADQVLTGKRLWSRLSQPQRSLLERGRWVADEAAKHAHKRFVISGAPVKAPARTLQALRTKGVLDTDHRLTWEGVYALLWGLPDARWPLPPHGAAVAAADDGATCSRRHA